jgi:hypothetical protein
MRRLPRREGIFHKKPLGFYALETFSYIDKPNPFTSA